MGSDEEPGGSIGHIERIARFPVKSMLGEVLDDARLTEGGLVGDRAYALVDQHDGKVASAKHPRKWGRLLEFRASFVEPPSTGGGLPPVEITFPDGTTHRSDEPAIDDELSKAIGREVVLARQAPDDRRFEEVWPDVEGLAPDGFIASTRLPGDEEGQAVSEITLGMAAPAGTFFDVSVLHLLTTSTLEALRASAAGSGEAASAAGSGAVPSFDWRRYRPNIVIDTREAGFLENGWGGVNLSMGDAVVAGELPTMRCVMTTLPQGDLPLDQGTLRTIAAVNRIEIPGLGVWACAGLYARVARAGVIRTGDAVTIDHPA